MSDQGSVPPPQRTDGPLHPLRRDLTKKGQSSKTTAPLLEKLLLLLVALTLVAVGGVALGPPETANGKLRPTQWSEATAKSQTILDESSALDSDARNSSPAAAPVPEPVELLAAAFGRTQSGPQITENMGEERDGESAFAAGAATAAPFDAQESGPRSPLRRYAGKTIVLLTDTRNDYAAELLVKLDSFIVQANAAIAKTLDVAAPPKPVQIIVFESQERYQEYAREHAPGLVNNGGYYDGGMRTVVTYRFNNSMQLYFHELVHAMMGEQFSDHNFSRYTRKHWPIWFDEGISEYIGSFDAQGNGIHIPAKNKGKLAYLANAQANNVFIDLATLLKAPAERFSGASMNIYYAESWGLIDFLLSAPNLRGKLPPFFRKIRQGEDGLQAFKSVYGEDISALDAQWRAHIYEQTQARSGWMKLFSGESIDDWTIHEGGQWRVANGEIQGAGDRLYNYLIKHEIPLENFSYELDLRLERGVTGLILGNNFHGEYPYYYLIEIARDAVLLKRAWSANQIEPVIQAYAELPLGEWVHVRVTVVDRILRMQVGGREVLTARVDRDRYSLFGLYLYRARVRFKNIQIRREGPETLGLAVTPAAPPAAGGPAEPQPKP